MSTLAIFHPPQGLALVTRLVWQSCQAMREAIRAGDRCRAIGIGQWLANTRDAPDCPDPLRRTIAGAMEDALATFGGSGPALEPLQSDDGEVA